jgi:hypothetical protein
MQQKGDRIPPAGTHPCKKCMANKALMLFFAANAAINAAAFPATLSPP